MCVCVCVDWIGLVQDRERRTLHHGVSKCLQVVVVSVIVDWEGLPVCCDVY